MWLQSRGAENEYAISERVTPLWFFSTFATDVPPSPSSSKSLAVPPCPLFTPSTSPSLSPCYYDMWCSLLSVASKMLGNILTSRINLCTYFHTQTAAHTISEHTSQSMSEAQATHTQISWQICQTACSNLAKRRLSAINCKKKIQHPAGFWVKNKKIKKYSFLMHLVMQY